MDRSRPQVLRFRQTFINSPFQRGDQTIILPATVPRQIPIAPATDQVGRRVRPIARAKCRLDLTRVDAPYPHGCHMPLEPKLKHRIERVLSTVDDHGSLGKRLSAMPAPLAAAGAVSADGAGGASKPISIRWTGLLRHAASAASGRRRRDRPPGRTNLKDRCEQAAELLVSLLANDVEEKLLDRTTRLLMRCRNGRRPWMRRSSWPTPVNLDDFGMTG